MRPARHLALIVLLLTLSGCRKNYVVPETPMPPNTILLSQMMRELSAQPGFTDALLAQIDKGGKKGPALLTPQLIDELRKRILGKDWQGLDRFPGWTMREVNPTVRVVGHVAGKNEKLEATASVHPGTPLDDRQTRQYLDLGAYALDKSEVASLDQPSTLPGFTPGGGITKLGAGVERGDGPSEIASEDPESQRLANTLNRLAANRLTGAAPFTAKLGDRTVDSPQDLIAAFVAAGHEITVDDTRYFANFGHLHYKGEDVMMPFWVNSQIAVPHSGGRPLLIPVSHAEYEWHIRAPQGRPGINADVAYYFGIDGKAEWRTMDTLDQPWVLKRNAHEYRGAEAVEVTRLAALLTVAYMHQHAARPELPFGGYYALGVCQDGVSAIEHKMTGRVTLFPNTADSSLFDDPRDAEVNALIAAIPKDRAGAKPEPERIFGSLPTGPSDIAGQTFNAITIPGLADDLNVTYAAWKNGTLERTHSIVEVIKELFDGLAAAIVALFLALKTRRLWQRGRRG